jgi:hypothetical protein
MKAPIIYGADCNDNLFRFLIYFPRKGCSVAVENLYFRGVQTGGRNLIDRSNTTRHQKSLAKHDTQNPIPFPPEHDHLSS